MANLYDRAIGIFDKNAKTKIGNPVAANQANSTATTVAGLKDDLNALLAKLKTAGIMVADTPAAQESSSSETAGT